MKSSAILREAAIAVDDGRRGLFSATRYLKVEDGNRVEAAIRAVLPDAGADGLYKFSPFNLSEDHRATILCLAASIAEAEGD